MNCTPNGTEPVIGVAENIATGALVNCAPVAIEPVAGDAEKLDSGVALPGVLLQPVRTDNANATKARTTTIFAIAVHQLL